MVDDIASQKVFRYMDNVHIDEFFNSGRLMLTSYARCVAHESEVRRDANEGKLNFLAKRGDEVIAGIQRVGAHSYMLCASKQEGRSLMHRFGVNSYFAIRDIDGFSRAVSSRIPRFVDACTGQCEYVEERSIVREHQAPSFDEPVLDTSKIGVVAGYAEEFFHTYNRAITRRVDAVTGERAYFIKEARYAEEAEFRFVWRTQSTAEASIFVECPEAVEFCERRS